MSAGKRAQGHTGRSINRKGSSKSHTGRSISLIGSSKSPIGKSMSLAGRMKSLANKVKSSNSRTKVLIACILLFILFTLASFIYFYAGRLLFPGKKPGPSVSQNVTAPADAMTAPEEAAPAGASGLHKEIPVVYRHFSETIGGEKQEIRLLEVNAADSRVSIFPVLSHDMVFGFECLSDIARRSGAYAAVNGGFFHEYGEPSGMVAAHGEIIKNPTGKYPVFMFGGGRASLAEPEPDTGLWLETARGKFKADSINAEGAPGKMVLYTPFYGSDSRASGENITAVIVDGVVVKTAVYDSAAAIPENGVLLTVLFPSAFSIDTFPLQEGDFVKLSYRPALGDGVHAYECGSWIVRNGEVVVKNHDEWIGVTTNRDPRTAVGLKDDRTVILITVDGRQPGYSAGLTLKELGGLLLRLGVRDAAMLDGGASTEMIVEGKIVNRPSFKGRERPVGGALVVKLAD